MNGEETDRLLREFLESENNSRNQGATLASLLDEVRASRREVTLLRNENATLTSAMSVLSHKIDTMHRLAFEVAKDRLVDRDRIARQGKRLDAIEHQVSLMSTSNAMRSIPDWEPDPMLKTGVHNLAEIQRAQKELEEKFKAEEARKQKELERKIESGIWWSRRKREVMLGAVVSLAIATIIGCAGYAVKPLVEKILTPASAAAPAHPAEKKQ